MTLNYILCPSNALGSDQAKHKLEFLKITVRIFMLLTTLTEGTLDVVK